MLWFRKLNRWEYRNLSDCIRNCRIFNILCNAKTALLFSKAVLSKNKEGFSINRTFSCSYGQLQTSAYASGWG